MSDYLYESTERTDYDDRLEREYAKYIDNINNESNDAIEEIKEAAELEIDGKNNIHKVLKSIKVALTGNIEEKLIILVYVVTFLRIIYDTVCFFRGALNIDYRAVSGSFVYYALSLIIPFTAWVYSTRNKFKKFSYTITKLFGLVIATISMSTVVLDIVFLCCCMFAVPLILKIPISADITASMITTLAMLCVLIPPIGIYIAVLKSSLDLIFKKETLNMISSFMVDRNFDTRKNKNIAYDYAIAKTMMTGKVYRVAEAVRKMHMLVLGPTGAGKTSMAFTTAIAEDLDKRTSNENKLKKRMAEILKNGEAVLTKDIEDKEFDLKYFRPVNDTAKKKIKEAAASYPLCGITLVAPNASFGDEIYELCKNRGVSKINRVDPVLDDNGNHKEGFIGFNPFYINPDLSEFDKRIELINKARIFADVLQMIYESGGVSDTYFSGLNKQITSCMCTLIMKGYPLLHEKFPDRYRREQACPQQFLDVMNDFSLAKDYVEIMEEYIRKHPDERLDYENKIKRIQYDLLGEGAKTMREQARGLVNIISDILANPLIRDILCAENSMDLDKSLAENYVTIINYELSLGESDSKGFGDFFLLSFQTAVFRRPKNNRPFHMLYIDEFPVLLHPSMEKMFSLYRQYGVCVAVAVQTLSQFKKSQSTAFMREVVLNNARTHIIFGGLGPDEMKYYEDLGGKDYSINEQVTTSETALSLEETQQSDSARTTLMKDQVFTGRELRNKDFQQATMVTIDEKGNVKDAFAVRFDFISDKKIQGVHSLKIDWHQFYNEEYADGTEIIDNKEEYSASDIMKNVRTSMTAMVKMSDGYEVQNKDILENTIQGFDVTKGASVVRSELTMYDQIERIRQDITSEKTEPDNSITTKVAQVNVSTNKAVTNAVKEEVTGINAMLDFEISGVNINTPTADTRKTEDDSRDNDAGQDKSKNSGGTANNIVDIEKLTAELLNK